MAPIYGVEYHSLSPGAISFCAAIFPSHIRYAFPGGLRPSMVVYCRRRRRGQGCTVPGEKPVTMWGVQFEPWMAPRTGRIWAPGGEGSVGMKE